MLYKAVDGEMTEVLRQRIWLKKDRIVTFGEVCVDLTLSCPLARRLL